MNSDPVPLLIVIMGPTAVGKTSFSIELAKELDAPVISADSRQFYREMSIGTARTAADEMGGVAHYFTGFLSVRDQYNVSRFEQDVLKKLGELFTRHQTVIMAGGSGLYIDAVCHGIDELPDPDESLRDDLKKILEEKGIAALQEMLKVHDPVYYEKMDKLNPSRLIRALEVCIMTGKPYSSFRKEQPVQRDFRIIKIGLDLPREILYRRINDRVDEMIRNGLVEEARSLLAYRELNALKTVGYTELFQYFDGNFTLVEAIEKIKTNSRRYAKRQLTWFKRDPEIRWIDAGDIRSARPSDIVRSFLP
jgi:tRNA dimethylallyltransferase